MFALQKASRPIVRYRFDRRNDVVVDNRLRDHAGTLLPRRCSQARREFKSLRLMHRAANRPAAITARIAAAAKAHTA